MQHANRFEQGSFRRLQVASAAQHDPFAVRPILPSSGSMPMVKRHTSADGSDSGVAVAGKYDRKGSPFTAFPHAARETAAHAEGGADLCGIGLIQYHFFAIEIRSHTSQERLQSGFIDPFGTKPHSLVHVAGVVRNENDMNAHERMIVT